jgi:tetratricopeptide (TPR) repeat protein
MTSDYNTRAEEIISDNSHSYFENRLLNSREPHYISSFEDLIHKIDCYNSSESLTKVDINVVLREGLTKVFTQIENSGFEYASEIIDRITPRRTENFDYLDKLPMSLYVSIFLYGDKYTRAKRLLWLWCGRESNRSLSFADQDHFDDIDSKSIVEFIFQVAIRRIKVAQYQGTLPIFETVYKTTSKDENLHMHDIAVYNSLMRRGYRNLHTNPSKSRGDFDQAINIIRDSEVLDYDPESDKYIRALDSKCKAVVNDYENSSDIGSAITYLSKFIDNELSSIQRDSYLRDRVEGLRSELIAKKYLQDRSLDLAVDQLDDAIQNYRNSGKKSDEDQSLRLFIQQKTIKAYQSETVGAFQDAAETYDELSIMAQKGLGSKNTEKAFTIRSHLCRAKHSILNNNLGIARDHINTITDLGPARRENEIIGSILDLLEDYENSSISNSMIDTKVVSEELSGMLFEIEVNYKPASSVLPAVQHIRQYRFEKDLLDPMVMITLQNCFIPNDAEGKYSIESKSLKDSEYSYLIELSTSDRWQAKLPSHIHYLIEQLKVNEVSAAGNYSPLADQATKILELFLEVFSEYYSETINEVSSPDSTLNPLIDFIHSIPENSVPNISETQSILKDSILEKENIGNVRNTTHHGERIHID